MLNTGDCIVAAFIDNDKKYFESSSGTDCRIGVLFDIRPKTINAHGDLLDEIVNEISGNVTNPGLPASLGATIREPDNIFWISDDT